MPSRAPAFTIKVVLVVLVGAALLAVALSKGIGSTVEEGALAQAGAQSEVLSRSLDGRALARAASRGRTTASQRRRMTALLGRVTDSAGTARVVNDEGRVVFSSLASERGGSLQSPQLSRALEGRTASAANTIDGTQVYDTFVPLRASASAEPAAALQIEMPAAPIQAAVAGKKRTLYAIVFAGLLVIGAVLAAIANGARGGRRAGEDGEMVRDTLTGLPHRARFNKLLEQAVSSSAPGRHVAVLLMDLDRFKEINDSLGHFNGDLVIERVGKRLAATLHEGEVVARLGGDEFALLLPDVGGDDEVRMLATRVHKALEEPFTAGGLALRVEASIGGALYPRDGENPSNLLRAADVAMYAAKEAHSGFEIYSASQRRYTPERLGLVAQLQRAMDNGELVLYYQPKARLDTGTVVGVEALVRWNHPQRGLLMPDEFIPVTEHTSMIRPVTIHLLEQALEQSRAWRMRGLDLSMAVNLSAQLLLDLGLPREIGQMLSGRGAVRDRLEVEITESAIAADPRRAQKILGGLRQMGVGVAVDDFGTGFSSLVSLKQLPVTTLKVDKSFVMGMASDSDDVAIVRSTVVLGRDLGLQVVAEGVEDQATWNALRDMGGTIAQGYHLSRPLPPEDFDRWLLAYRDVCPGGVRQLLPHHVTSTAAGATTAASRPVTPA